MSQTTSSFNSASATWEEHRSAFFNAIKNADIPTIESVLAKYPEAVEWQDQKGQRPLHLAFEQRDRDTFLYFLEKGANPDQTAPASTFLGRVASDWDDLCILTKTVKKGEKDFVVPLLQHGASTTSTYGWQAPKNIRYEMDDLLERADKIRAEFKASQKKSSAPALQAVTTPDASQEIEVLKPVKMKNRSQAQTP